MTNIEPTPLSYQHVQTLLNVATATSAAHVTLRFSEGTHTVPLEDALEGWEILLPGEEFTILALHWEV